MGWLRLKSLSINFCNDFLGATGKNGYKSEWIAGYCFPTQQPGTIPLYRYYQPHHTDHFYTTNAVEVGMIQWGEARNGYTSEGVQCYVYPKPAEVLKEGSFTIFSSAFGT